METGRRRTHFWGRSSAWLERRPVTPEVASSILVAPANYNKGLQEIVPLVLFQEVHRK